MCKMAWGHASFSASVKIYPSHFILSLSDRCNRLNRPLNSFINKVIFELGREALALIEPILFSIDFIGKNLARKCADLG